MTLHCKNIRILKFSKFLYIAFDRYASIGTVMHYILVINQQFLSYCVTN